MKRKEKAAVDEFVALVGGKTWEPVRHKCMGKWSGMTDYGFVIDGRITLFVSNSWHTLRNGFVSGLSRYILLKRRKIATFACYVNKLKRTTTRQRTKS